MKMLMSDSCPAFQSGKYNTSYGFTAAAQAYHKTFLPSITKRLNKMSDKYTLTGISFL
jgi:hypothetical protein